MHGLIFETSIWLLAGSTRLVQKRFNLSFYTFYLSVTLRSSYNTLITRKRNKVLVLPTTIVSITKLISETQFNNQTTFYILTFWSSDLLAMNAKTLTFSTTFIQPNLLNLYMQKRIVMETVNLQLSEFCNFLNQNIKLMRSMRVSGVSNECPTLIYILCFTQLRFKYIDYLYINLYD